VVLPRTCGPPHPSTPTLSLLRSRSNTSRHRFPIFPNRSRVPMTRNPHFSWIRMLPAFSGKMPACRVQSPASSEARTRAPRSRVPTPSPLVSGATYTATSPTPPYTHRSETGLRAAQPRIFPSDSATNRHFPRNFRSHPSQSGASVSKVAWPVAMPAR
jgi:hypothetical protein